MVCIATGCREGEGGGGHLVAQQAIVYKDAVQAVPNNLCSTQHTGVRQSLQQLANKHAAQQAGQDLKGM